MAGLKTRDRSPSPSNSGGKGKNPAKAPAEAMPLVSGLEHLDWMADRLSLKLYDRSSKSPAPRELMESRVDGYLCRRDYVQSSADKTKFSPRFNQYPLAILEAKPFTRLSALSHIRWQESAEIASWVSGLEEKYEQVGLLRSSTSGRKRLVAPSPFLSLSQMLTYGLSQTSSDLTGQTRAVDYRRRVW